MPQVNESISIADRVAALVLAVALVTTVTVIATVGPNAALLEAATAGSEGPHKVQSENDVAPESHSNYFPSPVTAPDAEIAEPIATF